MNAQHTTDLILVTSLHFLALRLV